jgi:hypothetical protein
VYDSNQQQRPTVSRPVCLGIKHPSVAYGQIVISVRRLQVCWCGVFSLKRGLVCLLQLLLVLASKVILESGSRGTRDHTLLSQIRDFPLRYIVRLTGLRWRYSTPPPGGRCRSVLTDETHPRRDYCCSKREHSSYCITLGQPTTEGLSQGFSYSYPL